MNKKQILFKALVPAMFAAALLFNSSETFGQVKIGSNPTVINAANNLEVEASTAGRKTSVDKVSGQVTIKDGTEGAFKVLTSDVNGAASWQTLRTTAITSFIQSAPGFYTTVPFASGTCAPTLGAVPPSCSVDINQNGSFSVTNSINDVIIDLVDAAVITGNTSTVYFLISVFIDKTTPGVFEAVDSEFVTYSNLGCGTAPIRSKVALKNLPVRANYNVKVYYTPWVNFGVAATLGIGTDTSPGSGCGAANSYLSNKMIISVSQ